jgi:TetR/AcrR family transcriptional regulator, mexJK operon transcriptional repressor
MSGSLSSSAIQSRTRPWPAKPRVRQASDQDDDRRRAILAAAGEVFLGMGYANATIDEVIRRLGGSKRTLYQYFDSKKTLFAAVVDEVVGEIVRPLPEIGSTKLGLRDTLLFLSMQHMTVVLSNRHIALMRLVAAESPRVPEVGRTYYEHGPARGHAKLRSYFEQQRRKGLMNIPDVARAADYFWGMLLHHETLRRLYHVDEAPSPDQVVADCAALVDNFLAWYGTPSALAGPRKNVRTAPRRVRASARPR